VAAFVVSPYAHARIVRIDASAARAMHGVRAVVAGADIVPAISLHPQRLAGAGARARELHRRIRRRRGRRHARDREAAAAAVIVEYEELPAVFDSEASLADGAPLFTRTDMRFRTTARTRPARPPPQHAGLRSCP